MTVHAVLGLTGLETDAGGARLSAERFVRIPLPQPIDVDHIRIMQRDLEMMLEMTRKDPDRMVALHNAVATNDLRTAGRLAEEVGLSEDNFVPRGGGIVGAILLGAALLIVFGALLASDTPPTPEPVDAGAPDAGVG